MNENNPFYEMVKRWTIYDFKTPGIKAEVIIDMLLSEFIKEIVAYAMEYNSEKPDKNRSEECCENKTPTNIPSNKYYLVAKEFPVPNKKKTDGLVVSADEQSGEAEDNRNAKADYLLAKTGRDSQGKKVVQEFILTELKTTTSSRNKEQEENYLSIVKQYGKADLFRTTGKILKKTLDDSLLQYIIDGKRIRQVHSKKDGVVVKERKEVKLTATELEATEKYVFFLENYLHFYYDMESAVNDSNTKRTLADYIREENLDKDKIIEMLSKYGNTKTSLVYIMLYNRHSHELKERVEVENNIYYDVIYLDKLMEVEENKKFEEWMEKKDGEKASEKIENWRMVSDILENIIVGEDI